MNTNRIEWADIAKGFAIILVILGHTLNRSIMAEELSRGLIFSFHMPLFFTISGLTTKYSSTIKQFNIKIIKSFKHLIIPALVVYGINIVVNALLDAKAIDLGAYIRQSIYTLVFCNGVDVTFYGTTIPAIRMIWFLFVLFFSRTLFDYLQLKLSSTKLLLAVCFLSVLGVVLGLIQWLPFCLDLVMSVLPFLYLGMYLKNSPISEFTPYKYFLSLLIWLGSFAIAFLYQNNYLDLSTRQYPYFPLCYITAFAGTLFFIYNCQLFLRLKSLSVPIKYLGKNSMYIFCIHAVEDAIIYIRFFCYSGISFAIIRLMADITFFVIAMIFVETVRKKYN